MKTLFDIELNPGRHSLKYYRFYTPASGTLRTKKKILEAINKGIIVYCYDKIMATKKFWNGTQWQEIRP